MLFKRDSFGHVVLIKWLITFLIGSFTHILFRVFTKMTIEGTEQLFSLKDTNVLFVSNHQTYFVDAIAFYHIFSSVKNGCTNSLKNPLYLFNPRLNSYYIAAEETMKSGIFPKMLAYVGAVSVRRTWRDKNKSVKRQMRFTDITNIGIALDHGWVITFPQGTTQPNAPGRRGVVYIIKKYKPVVIPIVIDGFSRAFQRKGIFPKKWRTSVSIRFKKPLTFRDDETPDEIVGRIMTAIEQNHAPVNS